MSISKEDFTSNEEIKDFMISDNTIDVIGYVSLVSHNLDAPKNKKKFYKFVVDNDDGTSIQVIAWNENVQLIEHIKVTNIIVCVEGVTCVNADKKFNDGNVDVELLAKSNSKITIHGEYKNPIPKVVDLATIEELKDDIKKYINKKIKIEGFMHTPITLYSNQDINYYVGAITNFEEKVEIKCDFNPALKELKMGEHLEITGIVVNQKNGPVQIKISSINDIFKYDGKRASLKDISQGSLTLCY